MSFVFLVSSPPQVTSKTSANIPAKILHRWQEHSLSRLATQVRRVPMDVVAY